MENTEIMTNNEVLEVAEEFVDAGSGKGLKLVGGAVLLGGLIFGGYKLIKKLKAKKDQAMICDADCNSEVVDDCVSEVE